MEEQIDIADFLVIAERLLGIDARSLRSATRLAGAESALAAPFAGFGDPLFYPDPIQRAAIVCSRVIRNHPLPDGNKRVGYLCMLTQLSSGQALPSRIPPTVRTRRPTRSKPSRRVPCPRGNSSSGYRRA